MKKILALCFFLIVGFAAFAQSDAKAKEILNKMSTKYKAFKTMQVSFSFILENTREKVTQEQKGLAYVKGTRFHVELGDQTLYCDGTTLYTFLKEANEVNVSTFKPGDDINPANIFTAYQKGYKYTLVTDAQAAAQNQVVIDLTPEDTKKAVYKIRLTITKKTTELVSARIFEKSGTRYLYKISKFEANKALKEDLFLINYSHAMEILFVEQKQVVF